MDSTSSRRVRHGRRLSVASLDRDRASISSGIALVARQQARRVVLVGLRGGERLLADAVAEGLAAGVLVRLDRRDGAAPAIVVSRPEL
ncbi:MAG: hypothetical protein E6H96_01235 [Chloroflexi bacterium]|nr:MAG: hypothetical protein E6H96_01235 [Chloroflexota bacterium]